jgi:hypothetical protein
MCKKPSYATVPLNKDYGISEGKCDTVTHDRQADAWKQTEKLGIHKKIIMLIRNS